LRGSIEREAEKRLVKRELRGSIEREAEKRLVKIEEKKKR